MKRTYSEISQFLRGRILLGSFLYEPKEGRKISIEDGTAETHRGFESPMKIQFTDKIKLSELTKLSNYDLSVIKKFDNQFIIKPDLTMPLAKHSINNQNRQKFKGNWVHGCSCFWLIWLILL